MSHKLSQWALIAAVVGMGVFFFQIVQPFLLPLFLALVLAILFWPLNEKIVDLYRGRRHLAALTTTAVALALLIVPVAVLLVIAGQNLMQFTEDVWPSQTETTADSPLHDRLQALREKLTDEEFAGFRSAVLDGASPTMALQSPSDRTAVNDLAELEDNSSPEDLRAELQEFRLSDVLTPQHSPWMRRLEERLTPHLPPETVQRLRGSLSDGVNAALRGVYARTRAFIANAITAIVAFAVMAVALYYFLADGPEFAETMKRLIPLKTADEISLFQRFDDVCRGVILGTFASAFVMAVLLSAALLIAGVPNVWLLFVLTLISSMIPFIGAAGVYVPVSIWLAFEQQYVAAVLILAYGTAIVSSSDNLVRAFVLQGRANLHPLVGLVSMLGGLQMIGLWGIFIGPIVAGFFYGLLKILHERLEEAESARPLTDDDPVLPPHQETESGVIVPLSARGEKVD